MHRRASARNVRSRADHEHISGSYAECLEPESTVQIYGTHSDELAQMIDVASQGRTDEAATICEPFAGFSRLSAV
jgi:hypothetical protein